MTFFVRTLLQNIYFKNETYTHTLICESTVRRIEIQSLQSNSLTFVLSNMFRTEIMNECRL